MSGVGGRSGLVVIERQHFINPAPVVVSSGADFLCSLAMNMSPVVHGRFLAWDAFIDVTSSATADEFTFSVAQTGLADIAYIGDFTTGTLKSFTQETWFQRSATRQYRKFSGFAEISATGASLSVGVALTPTVATGSIPAGGFLFQGRLLQ